VTEWGATPSLRNQPDGARAFHIIQVSHPTFRGDLAEAAKKKGLLNDQQVAQIRAGVLPSIEGAPADIREHLADEALAKGLITNDQHTKVVVDLLVPNVP
jgi:acyl-CoA hydrolase